MRVVILFSILFLFWLLLSGIYNSLTIFLGFFSCLLVVWFSIRLDVIDHEGHPIHLALKAITGYWPWLSKEIFI
ncbi:MAG: hypothetical protein CBD16_01460, partial [Betaproteobacteria bacterium TMED156]